MIAEADLYLRDDMVKRPDPMVVDVDAIHGQRYRRTPHLDDDAIEIVRPMPFAVAGRAQTSPKPAERDEIAT